MMKFKSIILVLLSVIFFGCNSEYSIEDIDGKPELRLSKTELFFESESSNYTISLSVNGKWTTNNIPDWCEISPSQGEGNSDVLVAVLENKEHIDRYATITFLAGDEKVDLKITQYQPVETNYQNIDWEEEIISSYNSSSGDIVVDNAGQTILDLQENAALVLPEEYGNQIRVVKSISTSGGATTVTTETGDMSHLFRNIEFTLATNPNKAASMTRSISGRVIAPYEVGVITDNGYEVLFDKQNIQTRTDYDYTASLIAFNQNYNGTDLYNADGKRVFFEKAEFEIGLDAVFQFKFGERKLSDASTWLLGELEEYKMYLDGEIDLEYLIKCILSSSMSYSKGVSDIEYVKKNIVKELVLKFKVGAVPVIIKVDTHLCKLIDVKVQSNVEMFTGCEYEYNTSVGLEYTDHGSPQVTPIYSATSEYTAVPPTITAVGAISAKGSIYPKYDFAFYGIPGPYIEAIPYIQANANANVTASIDGENTFMWSAKTQAGLAYRAGLDLSFLDDDFKWNTKIKDVIDPIILSESPNKISIDENSTETRSSTSIIPGEKTTVRFLVQSLNKLTGEYSSCPLAIVELKSTYGQLDKTIAIADTEGIVTAEWIPKNINDGVTATVVGGDREVISLTTIGKPAPVPNLIEITSIWYQKGYSRYYFEEEERLALDQKYTIEHIVYSIDDETGEKTICPNIKVNFESTNGLLDNDYDISSDIDGDMYYGKARAYWTPTNQNASLIAKIYDANGDILAQKIYNPQFDYVNVTKTNSSTSAAGRPLITIRIDSSGPWTISGGNGPVGDYRYSSYHPLATPQSGNSGDYVTVELPTSKGYSGGGIPLIGSPDGSITITSGNTSVSFDGYAD